MALSEGGLPRQAQENADKAEEFMATLFPASGEEEDTDKDKEQEAGSDGEGEGAKEEKDEEGSAEDKVLETADQETQDEEEDGAEEESYRKRYETLQGKYNAEVPKLNTELRKLKDDIFERLGDLDKKVAQPSTATAEDDTDPFEAELEVYREQHGDDLLDLIEKITERKAKQFVGESLEPVSEKVDSVESAQIESAQAAFTDDLTDQVEGDWKPLWNGEDDGFMAFLDSEEPNGLFTYREIASKANDEWDAAKLSKVFNTYLASIAPPEKKAEEKEEAKPEEKADESRVAPSRKAVSAEPKSGEARIWTQADIADFKTRDRQGKIPQEESDALWNDFLRAPSEGRIVA
jgi:hypothetical protein